MIAIASYWRVEKPPGRPARPNVIGDAFCRRCKDVHLGQVRHQFDGRITVHPLDGKPYSPIDSRPEVKCPDCGTLQTIDYEPAEW